MVFRIFPAFLSFVMIFHDFSCFFQSLIIIITFSIFLYFEICSLFLPLTATVKHIRLSSRRASAEIFLLSNWTDDIMRVSGYHTSRISITAEGLL